MRPRLNGAYSKHSIFLVPGMWSMALLLRWPSPAILPGLERSLRICNSDLNAPQAKRSVLEALDLSSARDVEYGAAFALALSGDSSRSRALAEDLQTRFPEDTSVQFSYLPVLHALFAVNDGEASKAVDLLHVAAPYELGTPGSSFNGNFGSLYPVYVRGLA